jgi:FtsZ-binding cell division protein ZapB
MPDPDEDLSPTLAETARRRADLREALVDVEQATSRPAVGREPDWAKGVLLRLEELAHAIDEHIEITERTEGLYDEISTKAPHLATKMDRLREEHPVLRERTRALVAKLQTTEIGPEWPLDEARDDLQRLLGQIVRHRQLGSDLVWEAYNLDIGGIE